MKDIRMAKVQIIMFLTFFLLTSSLTYISNVEAVSETVVKVDPLLSFARTGEAFTVNITVVNVQNLYGVEIKLCWNTSVLEVISVDVRLGIEDHPDGVLHNPVNIIQNETSQQEGKYVLVGLSYAPEPPLPPSFNGSGNIVRVTFHVISSGYCELDLKTTLVSNIIPPGSTAVETIAHTTINGFFGPILLTVYPKMVMVGESVNISGLIATAQANITVTIFYKLEEEMEWHTLETKTNEQGSYYLIWKPNRSGKYCLKATVFILGNQETSPIISINVSEPQQSPWPYLTLFIVIIASAIATLLMVRRRRTKK
jgi:hypothetical protein